MLQACKSVTNQKQSHPLRTQTVGSYGTSFASTAMHDDENNQNFPKGIAMMGSRQNPMQNSTDFFMVLSELRL
jgi:hypothetical protein